MNGEKILWPEWKTVRLIGRGSFGEVYEIQRQVFDDTEKAALKVISIPQNAGDIDEMYNDGYDEESITSAFQSHLKSIVAEYSLMRKLSGNPNIVHCEDVRYEQHADGIGWDIFIKMELLTPLAKAMPDSVSDDVVIKVAKDMCAALELCRQQNIVHRDIKPQNIFVSDKGEYKLGDFGIAKTVEKTMGGTKTGTYKYMAPEVYNNQPYGTKADIYSLGLVLYWMLNERRMPFMPLPPAKLTTGMEEKARLRRFGGEDIPVPKNGSEELQKIVLKACAFNPEERYATAAEMLAALNTIGVKPVVVPPVDVDKDPPGQETGGGDKPPIIEMNWRKLALWGGIAAVLLLIMWFCFAGDNTPEDPSQSLRETQVETTVPTETVPLELLPVQVELTEWLDNLPEYVTPADYVIEEQTLYSTQKLEKMTSTESDKLDGWTLVDTISNLGEYGPWSEWSAESVSGSDTRNVETQERYRYRTKETTTSNSSSKSGWELYDTTYTWGDYGSWSDWNIAAYSESDSRDVETKTQYQYRDKWVTQEYSDWGGWSNWSSNRESTSDLKKEDTRSVYGYYYFKCPNCGMHWYGSGITCFTWAGGCGQAVIPGDSWHEVWSTTSWANAGFWEYYGTGHYAASINGSLVFKWTTGYDGSPRTQYRYATRTIKDVTNYGEWSDYSDTVYTSSSTRDVNTRKVYRYRDRQQVPVYHFYRWGSWSDWSAKEISKDKNRDIETKKYYRYRDKVTETTYCFERWTEWSEYSTEIAEDSDEQKVQKKKQYRYRSKTADELRNPYTDIDESESWYDAVMWVTEQGIMNGTSADTFDPNGAVTRGQMVMMLWRAAGKPAPEAAECPYQDVPEDSVFLDAVMWAAQEGIAGGATADTFGLDEVCIQGQAITFLYRAAGKPEVSLTQEPFADVEPDDYYYEPVLWAYERSISSGTSATEFGVNAPCTRTLVAVMLYRTFADK